MATNAPTNTFLTGSAVGNREDLEDKIYRIDPTDTPFQSGIERGDASAVTHEWQTQALAAADATNAQFEGDTLDANTVTATVRLGNVCQISSKVASVSGTQEAVDHAGRGSEIDYQEMLKGLELKRDMEKILVGTNQAKLLTNSPRTTASVLSWIKSNTDKNSGSSGTAGADPATADGAATRTDASNLIAFNENRLKNVLQQIWTNGGKPNVVMTGATNKQAFSMFTGRGTTINDGDEKKLVASVDVYDGDFGKQKVVANRFQRARDVLVLQMDMWKLVNLNGRSMISIPLAKLGDSTRRQILSEYALEACNEKSSGGVFDCTN